MKTFEKNSDVVDNKSDRKDKTMEELLEAVCSMDLYKASRHHLCLLIQIESENDLSVISEFFKDKEPNAEIKKLYHDFGEFDVHTLRCCKLNVIIVDKNLNDRLVRSTTFNYAIITDVDTELFKNVIGCQPLCHIFYKEGKYYL